MLHPAIRTLLVAVAIAGGLALARAASAQCDQIDGCTLVWADEFDGVGVDPSKWELQTGDGTAEGIPGWGNNELQYYQSTNATVGGGVLTIEARQESVGGRAYTSARLRTIGHGDFLYGRFEIRAKLPLGQGIWPAFWMLPSNPARYGVWAASGEIDIMESIGSDRIYGTIHFGGTAPANQSAGTSFWLPTGGAAQFHEYAVEWEPEEIRWYIDDELYATQTSWFSTGGPFPAPFNTDFHLLLNLAVGGNFPGNPTPSTTFPKTYVVDYVRVYQTPPADPEKALRCRVSKGKTAAQYAKCASGVYAKSIGGGAAPDSSRLQRCAEKLASSSARAETAAQFSCPATDNAATIQSILDTCIEEVVQDLGGAPGGGGATSSCQAAKAKESGKFLNCLFKVGAKAAKAGAAIDDARCRTKLSASWARFESSPCATTSDRAAIEARLDACQAEVLPELAGDSCGNGQADDGEECDDGNAFNGDGCSDQCLIEPEYQQDFESLSLASSSALSGDGWIAYGNIFNGTSGNFLYGYGPYGAPNGGPGFSGLRTGQGGTDQGAQQLVIYSDYNSGEHANGNLVQAVVYRERTITAADVDKTFELTFDAKRGDLTGSSTAEAFIKVLNPATGYSQTSVALENTASTSPSLWSQHSVVLDVGAGLEGQLLQYGFAHRATSYTPSGIFYDNIKVTARPTLP